MSLKQQIKDSLMKSIQESIDLDDLDDTPISTFNPSKEGVYKVDKSLEKQGSVVRKVKGKEGVYGKGDEPEEIEVEQPPKRSSKEGRVSNLNRLKAGQSIQDFLAPKSSLPKGGKKTVIKRDLDKDPNPTATAEFERDSKKTNESIDEMAISSSKSVSGKKVEWHSFGSKGHSISVNGTPTHSGFLDSGAAAIEHKKQLAL